MLENLTSIVIPNLFLGKPGKLIKDGDEALWFAKNCLERIKKYTDIPYELILINDASIHGSELLKEYADIYIENKKREGFGRSCNEGFKRATGKYICCMNNDIFVWKDWLRVMIEELENIPNAGVIMPALMKQTKRGDEALKFETIDLSKNYSVVSPHAEFGSCWLIKRDFFNQLKERDGYYFDPTFEVGFGEDRDLWKRVRLAGKETYRTHKTRVFHQGNVTMGKIENRKLYTGANREYLAKKYGE